MREFDEIGNCAACSAETPLPSAGKIGNSAAKRIHAATARDLAHALSGNANTLC